MTASQGVNGPRSSDLPRVLWLGYVLFVVYGALVPFRYQPRPLGDAWLAFQNIPFLQLSANARADWIANGVLYVPLAILTLHLLWLLWPAIPRTLAHALTLGFAILLSVALEFAQVFFPGRTVSLNDLFAQGFGTVVGLLVASRYGAWYRVVQTLWSKPRRDFLALATATYSVVYLLFSGFPFDFVLSMDELVSRLHSPNVGWIVAHGSSGYVTRSLQMAVEVLGTLPFGVWLTLRLRGSRNAPAAAFALGLVLGGLIELVQLLLYSGVAQGVSVLARGFGFLVGAKLALHAQVFSLAQTRNTLRRWTPWIAAIHVLALMQFNGWFSGDWRGLPYAAKQLATTSYLPLYYHYFTTESRALFSVVAVCIAYAPVAILTWACAGSPLSAAAIAAVVAAVMETAKLFLDNAHPDVTNIWLAFAACWATAKLIAASVEPRGDTEGVAVAVESSGSRLGDHSGREMLHSSDIADTRGSSTPSKVQDLLVTGTALGLAALWLVAFPVARPALLIVLLVTVLVVWRQPVRVFAVVPAMLPILDLAPWSGRFFVDEFDAVMLLAAATAFVRTRRSVGPRLFSDGALASLVLLVATSFAVSLIIGLLPLEWPGLNALNSYFSPLNAARIAKGAFWAGLIIALDLRMAAQRTAVRHNFALGVVIGLTLTVAFVGWERVAFSGLWNFNADYRVTGPFSAIHTGGAYIETFLAVGVPFLVVLAAQSSSRLLKVGALGLLLASTYAVMVTYSRNGYFAFGAVLTLILMLLVAHSKRRLVAGVAAVAIAGASLVVVWPILTGDFAQARIATVRADLGTRLAHWADALAIRDDGLQTELFGMGLGRFPETSFWRSTTTPRSGSYELAQHAGNVYLRLSAGDSLYVEQLVRVKPGAQYRLSFDARPMGPDSALTIPICEKWLLTSYNCIWKTIQLGKDFGTWQTTQVLVDASAMLRSPWYSQRPIKLAIYYADRRYPIEVDNFRLESMDGEQLIVNGDFTSGLDRWFFSTDGHLQWHVKNLLVGLLFDQGWFGVFAVCALLALALGRASRCAARGDSQAAACLAALVGFLVVGVFDTLIDTPRFLLLMLVLVWFCATCGANWSRPDSRAIGAGPRL